MRLDPFYPIVDSAAWIERLVPLGVRLVQLRIKDMPDASLRDEIRRARTLCARAGCQLIVNEPCAAEHHRARTRNAKGIASRAHGRKARA